MAVNDLDDGSTLVVVHSVTSIQGYLAHPLGPLGSSCSQHRRTLELILHEGLKKTPTLRGPPKGPAGIGLLKVRRERRFYEQGTPVGEGPWNIRYFHRIVTENPSICYRTGAGVISPSGTK